MKLKATFTVYREGSMRVIPGQGRGWRWRLRAANGHIIADGGEVYSTNSKALRAVRSLLRKMGVDVSGSYWPDVVRANLGIAIVLAGRS